jgi:hypothetical protein
LPSWQGKDPLDAAIAGVNVVEDDPGDMTVGYGGVPNYDGVVQLDVGSAGSTGRGEANILVSGSHLAVELMRQGRHPKDACLEVLRRIAHTTREPRLLAAPGKPTFGITFYAVNKAGDYGSAAMYDASTAGKRAQFSVADARGARKEDCAYLFQRRA